MTMTTKPKTAAPDNDVVRDFHLYKTDGNWYVAFYDSEDRIMTHNIDLIADSVFRVQGPRTWARLTTLTKWGAKRTVKKFLAGKIEDFRLRPRPLP